MELGLEGVPKPAAQISQKFEAFGMVYSFAESHKLIDLTFFAAVYCSFNILFEKLVKNTTDAADRSHALSQCFFLSLVQ
jgi:hypothetical protein